MAFSTALISYKLVSHQPYLWSSGSGGISPLCSVANREFVDAAGEEEQPAGFSCCVAVAGSSAAPKADLKIGAGGYMECAGWRSSDANPDKAGRGVYIKEWSAADAYSSVDRCIAGEIAVLPFLPLSADVFAACVGKQ